MEEDFEASFKNITNNLYTKHWREKKLQKKNKNKLHPVGECGLSSWKLLQGHLGATRWRGSRRQLGSPTLLKAASGGWVTSLQFSLFTQAQLPVIHCQASPGSHSRVQWSHIACCCCCSQSNYNLWFSMWQWCATYSVPFKHGHHANAKDIVNLAPVNTALDWTRVL